MEITISTVLTFTLLGAFVHGLVKGKYVIGFLGWHRPMREGQPVRFVLFGLIYLAAALLFAWCLFLALRES
jgi:hypothetical protein